MEHDNISPEPPHPTPTRYRAGGWTVERQEAFLKAYAACGTIVAACKAVGMSRQSLRDLCARPSAIAFRAAFDAARDCTTALIEDAASERSIHGVPRPIFYKGEQVGEYREYDERLTMFLLRYRRRGRFGPQLDQAPPPMAGPHPSGLESEEPDGDEPMGRLAWHMDELTDEGDPPPLDAEWQPCADEGAASSDEGRISPRESIDKFDNFVGSQAQDGEID